MGFHHAHQHVTARLVLPLGGAEHRISFTNACAGTKVDAQLALACALCFAAKLLQQLVWVGSDG